MTDPRGVAAHYGTDDRRAEVNTALAKAGLDGKKVSWSDLGLLDQFHVRGLAASHELAAGLGLTADSTVLDVGSGLGGPARFLAATYGVHVTGIDLSQPFVDVATMLTERVGLSDLVTFKQANALDLPFSDGHFDHAWTQHVAMNIADRAGLYSSIRRVLKPGGRLALYDIVAGEGGPVTYPMPWARRAELSFLVTPDGMRAAVTQAGFKITAWADKTEEGVAFFAAQRAARVAGSAPPLGIQVVMGPEFSGMVENLARHLAERRVRVIQAIATRLT